MKYQARLSIASSALLLSFFSHQAWSQEVTAEEAAPAAAEEAAPAAAEEAAPAADEEAPPLATPPTGEPPVAQPPPVVNPVALSGPDTPALVTENKILTPQEYDDGYNDSLPSSESLLAQPDPKFMIGLGLDTSLPIGEAGEFARGFSFQGFSIDVRYLGFDEIQVGGMIAWHTMSNKLVDTIEEGPATLTGTMVRELSVTPMVAKLTYARLNKDGVVPYVSFGAGGARVLRRVDLGIARIVQENWQWALIPEAGVMLPVGPVMLMGAFRYNLLIAGSDQPTAQYLNFVLGVGLK